MMHLSLLLLSILVPLASCYRSSWSFCFFCLLSCFPYAHFPNSISSQLASPHSPTSLLLQLPWGGVWFPGGWPHREWYLRGGHLAGLWSVSNVTLQLSALFCLYTDDDTQDLSVSWLLTASSGVISRLISSWSSWTPSNITTIITMTCLDQVEHACWVKDSDLGAEKYPGAVSGRRGCHGGT